MNNTENTIEKDLKWNLSFIQDLFQNSMDNLKTTAEEIIPELKKSEKETIDRKLSEFKNILDKLNGLPNNQPIDTHIGTKIEKYFSKSLNDVYFKNPSQVIIKSIFLNIFSEFDAFLSNMLRYIFKENNYLINNSEKQYQVSDIIKFESIDKFRDEVIEKEIDTIIRKSYIEQFSYYEKKFSIQTLTKFENWKKFVEISQRRNIIMHCGGKVSTQYYEICKKHSCIEDNIDINSEISLNYDYLIDSINIVNEVGIKLLHVIWRKQLDKTISLQEGVLSNYIYSLLEKHDYKNAENFGLFACELKNYYEKINEYFFVINYGIALKKLDKKTKLKELLKKHDWSSVSYEFKTGKHILMDEFEEAYASMLKAGKNSDLFDEKAYLTFPLFDFVRYEPEFKNTFEKIFEKEYNTVRDNFNFKSIFNDMDNIYKIDFDEIKHIEMHFDELELKDIEDIELDFDNLELGDIEDIELDFDNLELGDIEDIELDFDNLELVDIKDIELDFDDL